MDNEQILALLEKSAITSSSGGKLVEEQAKQFIDLVKSQSEFLQMIDVIPMNSDKYTLNAIEVGRRLLRAGTENTNPSETFGINVTPRSLEVKEMILPFDITYDFLENNIEKESAKATIENLFAKQYANDVLDLAINGDSSLSATITDTVPEGGNGLDDTTGLSLADHKFLRINDGWLKLMRADSTVNRYTVTASITSVKDELNGVLKKLPEKHRTNPKELIFLLSADLYEDYADEIGVRATALGDLALTQTAKLPYKGINIFPLPYMPTAKATIVLTTPKNLALGIQRKFTIEQMRQPRARTVEYTMTSKSDFNYKVGELIVLGEKA